MTASPAVFKVEGLRVDLGGVRLVDGVDLELRAQELVLLLGRSGMGKSVFIKSLVGFIPAQQGVVTVAGKTFRSNEDAEKLRKLVTLVHQDAALLDDETVLDNVALPLQWRLRQGTKTSRSNALEALDGLGLAHAANKGAQELSAGERKTVALARALALHPQVLLLDEPVTGLDAASAAQVGQAVARIVQTGTAVLVVTHDVAPFIHSASRVALLHQGRLVVDQPAATAWKTPPAALRQFLEGSKEGPLAQGDVDA